MPAKVHFVDDDGSFLRMTSRLLRIAGFDVITYLSAFELLEDIRNEAKGCILADLEMPEMNGMDLLSAVQKTGNPLPVVFLSGSGNIPISVKALKQGAVDFLTKPVSEKDLIAAIEAALERNEKERRLSSRRVTIEKMFDLLSPRERQILECVTQGMLNKQIADHFRIHERTVKLHRTSITTKLGLKSVAELTKFNVEARSYGKL
jgi:FixJ family two-component response regulator